MLSKCICTTLFIKLYNSGLLFWIMDYISHLVVAQYLVVPYVRHMYILLPLVKPYVRNVFVLLPLVIPHIRHAHLGLHIEASLKGGTTYIWSFGCGFVCATTIGCAGFKLPFGIIIVLK